MRRSACRSHVAMQSSDSGSFFARVSEGRSCPRPHAIIFEHSFDALASSASNSRFICPAVNSRTSLSMGEHFGVRPYAARAIVIHHVASRCVRIGHARRHVGDSLQAGKLDTFGGEGFKGLAAEVVHGEVSCREWGQYTDAMVSFLVPHHTFTS